MENEIISIMKKPGVKNCVRINFKDDIPELLKDVIRIENNELILDCLEGEERVPVGSVIAFEKLENGKMNVWNKANWKESTREVDGIFYEIPKIYQAVKVGDSIPQTIVDGLGERFHELEDGIFQIDTDWGIVQCNSNDGYVVIYGIKKDGTLDANFLTKGTPSFYDYYVVDNNGEILESLEKYDQKIEEKRDSSNKVR
ncbi:MAG: hypothetical protein IKE70_06050 [Bacilli bacterium]|nr:hypothetical protein [Bacilli bacterium]